MLLHPSPQLWTRGAAENRLLASWGRDVLGLQTLLAGAGIDHHHPLPQTDNHDTRGGKVPHSGTFPPRVTLLAALQADVRADRPPPGPPLRQSDPDNRIELSDDTDRSIRVHACHGRARQVEVLREAILHRLAEDPTLEPRDVIVMCPDIEAFAPLIEASFGRRVTPQEEPGGTERERAPGEPPALRVRLADRSLRRTTPILGVIARLLELASSRVTASQVLDLADTAPVRARFGFGDDELAQIREWVATAGIHWGLDAAGRTAYKLGTVDAGTWAAGLKRLLLGVTIAPEAGGLFGGVLPVAEIQSSEIELAGLLAEFIDRLDLALSSLTGPKTVTDWTAAVAAAADFLTVTPAHEAWQRRQLDLILAEIADEAGAEAPELTLSELRTLLAHRLEGRPTRANFRSGHLTFCTLVPMRSVPHRVVCLLGLDDGAFPRQPPRDGDDLLLLRPRPGDRDPRTEDRQLLLDALLAARDALIITYSGNDERTNASLPPAVPVGELLDAIDATARASGPDGRHRARDAIVIHHPLQAFDPRNFDAAQPWSFDAAALAGASAFRAARHEPPPFLPEPLAPAPDSDLITLDELVAFVQRPVRAFLRQRLNVAVRRDEDAIDDALPIELDGLARWNVGQQLLEGVLAGVEPRDAVLAEIARGTLPPGELGRPVLKDLWPDVEAIASAARAYASGQDPRSEQTNITLPGGMRLTGTVGGVHGHVLLSVSYSRLGPRQRLAAWIRLLALTAANPEIAFETVTIGRGHEPGSIRVARIPQLGGSPSVRAEAALAQLGPLAVLRAEGLRYPLPLPCATAHAYGRAALQTAEDPLAAARREWDSSFNRPGEREEPEHRLVFDGTLDFDELGRLATQLWQPLLAREAMEG
jgi:exodeoxyribonuclease V gamma subunit